MTDLLYTEIKKRMIWGLIFRGQASSATIITLCLFIAYYQFGLTQYGFAVTVIMSLGAINGVFRYFIGAQAIQKKKSNKNTDRDLKFIFFTILFNILIWISTFWLVFSQSIIGDLSFITAFMTAVTMLTVSTLTLSYVPIFAILFQLGILSSLLYAYFKQYTATSISHYLYLAGSIVLLALYYVYQTKIFYKQMFDKYKYEVELELSLQQLKESNQKVIDETARSQNASRLASLGEMAGGIAHEINNPLAIISGLLERVTLQVSQPQISKDEITKNLNKASDSLFRISRIITSLLRIARKPDGREAFEHVQLASLFEDVLNISLEKFARSGINFEKHPEPDILVRTTPAVISQVLLNLLNNAFEHIVHLEEQNKSITIFFENTAEKIIVKIQNSGKLIDEKNRDKIFEPFFTTREVGKGTGLGLSVSKSSLESIGEQLWLDINASQTTFCFSLQKVKSN
jgi:signal transduction histidine kinase